MCTGYDFQKQRLQPPMTISTVFSKYSSQRKTQNLRIPYFVKDDFKANFAGDLRRIERQVEEEYVSNLRQNCWRERSYSKFSIFQDAACWFNITHYEDTLF